MESGLEQICKPREEIRWARLSDRNPAAAVPPASRYHPDAGGFSASLSLESEANLWDSGPSELDTQLCRKRKKRPQMSYLQPNIVIPFVSNHAGR